MNLRSRIMIVTFLIILFVQGLNCFLEVGFLANNLEDANLRKYRIIGNQMMRKINTSLIFGKPLSAIEHHRLLSNIIPADVENIHVIDQNGQDLYTAKKSDANTAFKVHGSVFNEKSPEVYRLFFPLTNRVGVQGNLVIEVSNQRVREKRLALIRKSILNFIIILACSLPVLYLLLTLFINRPYNRFIDAINVWLREENWLKLKEHKIDLSPLNESRMLFEQIKSAKWLVPDHPDDDEEIKERSGPSAGRKIDETLYEKLKSILEINV
ncbi:hypothetical protein [uncultured Desulfobacter sp.]|uniref:hypothetical protein n=1 Tax=uncultured Desulfobacter sp. TaxID=240139 RepID=UPI002AAB8AA4|nr:hypothetical protein [uncultured Desulfobacter sp.]